MGTNKQGKSYNFFLYSEYERWQDLAVLYVLQINLKIMLIINQLCYLISNYQLINYRYPTNKAKPTASSYPRNTKGRNGWKPCKFYNHRYPPTTLHPRRPKTCPCTNCRPGLQVAANFSKPIWAHFSCDLLVMNRS